MDEGFGILRSEGWADAGDVLEIKEGGLGDVLNVVLKGICSKMMPRLQRWGEGDNM